MQGARVRSLVGEDPTCHMVWPKKKKECGEKGTLVHCWWECKLIQPLWNTVWRFLKKLKIQLPYDPAIPLLGIYPKKMKTGSQRDVCTPVFPAALFTITKTGNNLSVHQQINGLRCGINRQIDSDIHTHNGILFSHKKDWNSAICSNTDRRRDHHTKWSKPDKDKYIAYMWNLKKKTKCGIYIQWNIIQP